MFMAKRNLKLYADKWEDEEEDKSITFYHLEEQHIKDLKLLEMTDGNEGSEKLDILISMFEKMTDPLKMEAVIRVLKVLVMDFVKNNDKSQIGK